MPQDSVSRELEAEMFRCLNPKKPHMCDKEDRMRTFSNSWHDQESSTPHELVNAGFYYMGSGDRVSCFYCGGRLFHWKLRDNPWYEHAKWFPLCEFVLKEQGVKYVEKVCQKHSGLHRSNIENPIRSAAANQLRTMLTNQTQSTVAAEERSQRLEAMMLLDPHVKYAKSIGIEDTKIRYALLQQMEKNNCNFSNCQELRNLILDVEKEDKCMKCKNKEKNAVCMPCGHTIFCWTCIQDIYSCWLCTQSLSETIRVKQW